MSAGLIATILSKVGVAFNQSLLRKVCNNCYRCHTKQCTPVIGDLISIPRPLDPFPDGHLMNLHVRADFYFYGDCRRVGFDGKEVYEMPPLLMHRDSGWIYKDHEEPGFAMTEDNRNFVRSYYYIASAQNIHEIELERLRVIWFLRKQRIMGRNVYDFRRVNHLLNGDEKDKDVPWLSKL